MSATHSRNWRILMPRGAEDLRQFLADLFHPGVCEVVEADRADFLPALGQGQMDLAVLDAGTPGWGILELLGQIADLTDTVPVVVRVAGDQPPGQAAFLQAVLDSLRDAVVVADDVGSVLFCNAAARQALGVGASGSEAVPWPEENVCLLADGVTPCPPAEQPLARAARGEAVDGQELFLHHPHAPGGIWVSAAARPLRDAAGEVRGGVVVYRDVTEERQVREMLRLSEQRYRNLVEGSAQGVVIHQDWRIRFANPAGARLFGYDEPRELVGRDWESLVAPEGRSVVRARALACLRGEALPAHPGWQGVRRDGEHIWVESLENQIPWEGRSAVAAFLIDVTERSRLEEQVLQAQKMEAVGQLAGGVAHDFNNLLTVINGYGELMLSHLRPEDPTRRLVQGILEAGERAAALTRQLLAFSRKQTVEPRVLDLNQLIHEQVRMLDRLIGEHIELRTRPDPTLASVRADPGQLEQVVMNLVVNARDAMPQGGVVTITTANVDLGEPVRQGLPGGPCVLLTVSDTGCGMDEATKAHIFEPFFTTKGPGKGTGLGLATVYGVVRANRGRIEVDTAPNRGATFRIYLPAAHAAPDVWAIPRSAPALPRGTETILLVEDDEGVRMLSRHVLQAQGYRVLEAVNGQEALDLCTAQREEIHLLVTDVVMPQLGGRELAELLLRQHPMLGVLFLSGYQDIAGAANNLMEAEHVAFLQKPFTPSALAATVRRLLDQLRRRLGVRVS